MQDALIKLADTKSPYKRKFTLLHYVVEHCEKAKPGCVAAVNAKLACCADASSYPFDMVESDITRLHKELREVRTVSAAAPTDDPQDQWAATMGRLCEEWAESMTKLDSDVVELMEEVASVCALWCCDKKASEAEATCSQLAKLMKLAMSALADLEAEKEQARDAGKKGKKGKMGKMSKQGRKKR